MGLFQVFPAPKGNGNVISHVVSCSFAGETPKHHPKSGLFSLRRLKNTDHSARDDPTRTRLHYKAPALVVEVLHDDAEALVLLADQVPRLGTTVDPGAKSEKLAAG